MKVYLASNREQIALAKDYAAKLEALGHSITHKWWEDVERLGTADNQEADGEELFDRVWRTKAVIHGSLRDICRRRAENIGGKGYLRISLHAPGRGLAIVMAHRLVYEVLVGPIETGKQINHKDLNKQNNTPSNLEVVTGAENIRHSYANGRTKPWSLTNGPTMWRGKPRITEDQRSTARAMRLKDIAAHFGIALSHAQRISGGAQ